VKLRALFRILHISTTTRAPVNNNNNNYYKYNNNINYYYYKNNNYDYKNNYYYKNNNTNSVTFDTYLLTCMINRTTANYKASTKTKTKQADKTTAIR
jgi:hypothetical protein